MQTTIGLPGLQDARLGCASMTGESKLGHPYLHLGERAGDIGLGVHCAIGRLRTALLCQALQQDCTLGLSSIDNGAFGK